MVVLLTLPDSFAHVSDMCKVHGHRHSRAITQLTYPRLVGLTSLPSAAYIFAERERMSTTQRRLVAAIWDRLATEGGSVRLLNHPLRQLGRWELLRALHEAGVNSFNAYRVVELAADIRFPVFVRRENDHSGPRTGLITSRDDLDRQLARLILAGLPPRDLIVVEYVHTADELGVFRKYGAFRIGDRIVAQHLYHSNNWATKRTHQIINPETRAESNRYFEENPDAADLMPFFEMANIEYGRMDYGFIGDRIQIWEINDNPMFVSQSWAGPENEPNPRNYAAALKTLGGPYSRRPIPFEFPSEATWDCIRDERPVEVA